MRYVNAADDLSFSVQRHLLRWLLSSGFAYDFLADFSVPVVKKITSSFPNMHVHEGFKDKLPKNTVFLIRRVLIDSRLPDDPWATVESISPDLSCFS